MGINSTQFFSTENESRVDIYLRIQIRLPHGGPWGSRGPPWEVSKESNDIRHVGYQFYSVFSTENESRVDTYLKFQIRVLQGDPWGSRVPLEGSPLNIMMQGMLSTNSTHIWALKTNIGSTHLQNFKIDSHRLAHWGPGVQRPP